MILLSWTVRTGEFKGASEVEINFSTRFRNDKVFTENDDYILILDGVLLNSEELVREYGKTLAEALITKLTAGGG
jgi:hypothetical protein